MRRITWVLAIVMSFALLLVGCGQKDASSVVKDLDQKMSKLNSYAGIGTMTLYAGQQPQEYQVEVWYQNPSYYRIELKNAKKDITQIVLRNDEGVFVLTPSLKKSFRFQSDWPSNQGQVYLYQTLIHSILKDNARQLVTEGDQYVFEVAANYQNDSLVKQKIWLNKNDYAPKQVQVSDADARVVMEMKFKQFEFAKKFDKDAFDMQRNMTAQANIDPLPEPGTGDKTAAVQEGTEQAGTPVVKVEEPLSDPVAGSPEGSVKDPNNTAEDPAAGVKQDGDTTGDSGVGSPEDDEGESSGPFGFIEPVYVPEGTILNERMETADAGVLIRFNGTYNFTIAESRQDDMEVGIGYAETIDLGFTFASLTGEEQRSLTWMNDGIKFRLTSGDLPLQEMVKIAQSMAGQSGK